MRISLGLVLGAALVTWGCGEPPAGGGDDSGTPMDSGSPFDAGGGMDSGSEVDSGSAPDSGALSDSGTPPDAGSVPDSGKLPDGGAPDAGGGDAGKPDAGAADSGKLPDGGAKGYDRIGVIGTGQSLSVGVFGARVSTTQPYGNMKLVDAGGTWTLAPLTEPIRPGASGDGQYPGNIYGESPASGMANEVSALTLGRGAWSPPMVHSVVGWSGHAMNYIDKDGGYLSYPSALEEARVLKLMSNDAGLSLAYRAVILTHGESDQTNPRYGQELLELWADYNADLKAITGQKEDIILIQSQQGSVGPANAIAPSTLAQWTSGLVAAGKIFLAGPKYQYVYVDKVHLTGRGYRRLGIKYGEVYDAVVNRNVAWQPLQPLSATRAGAVISVKFHVPAPPLMWDLTMPPSHQTAHTAWANGRGFEVQDSTGELTISSVAITADVVKVTLAQVPTGTGLVVRYAALADVAGGGGGIPEGRHGQLCDSDGLIGYDQRLVDVQVQNGSATVDTADGGNAFAGYDAREAVEAVGLPAWTLIESRDAGSRVTLTAPWAGTTGAARLLFHSDQRNYAVQFSMNVP